LFPPQQPHKRGFVDLIHQYAQSGTFPDVRDFIYSSTVEGIDVLPAGTIDQPYCEKLQELNWPAFFTTDVGDPGPFFGPFRETVKGLGYDYVLIDSRTGLNDQAGICTEILPDLVLVLFRLTSQNLDGLEHVVPAIRAQLEARRNTTVRLLPVASVVSPTSSGEMRDHKDKALRLFGAKALSYIRFDADLVNQERLLGDKNVVKSIWPLPPILGDYEKLSNAIREQNSHDTRTRMEKIASLMSKGDYVSVVPLIEHALIRRPRNAEVWAVLTRLLQFGALKRINADAWVEAVLQRDKKNSFCYEWKARRLFEETDSPQSQVIDDASKHLEMAIQHSAAHDRLRLLWLLETLARVKSAKGDLDGAIRALRQAQENSKKNAQLSFDLAKLHLRMGANYFSSAIDSLEGVSDKIEMKHVLLAYIMAFLGEEDKAHHSLQKAKELAARKRGDRDRTQLYSAHFLLIQGKRDEALDLAESATAGSLPPPDALNWAELFICAQEFDRAIRLLTTDKGPNRKMGQRNALLNLARYIGDVQRPPKEEEVVESWAKMDGWEFTELILFRERVLRKEGSPLVCQLGVIERVIQSQDLTVLRQQRAISVSGPSAMRAIRTFIDPEAVWSRFEDTGSD
jgi:hypothetical protein